MSKKFSAKWFQELLDKAGDEQPSPSVHMVSYEQYERLEYLTGEILKIDPGFLPITPWAIEFRAKELGIKCKV